MAVETVYGEFVLAKGQAAPPRTASFHHFNNPYKGILDRAAIPAGAEVASVVHMASLKPDAVLSSLGVFTFDALGASTTLAIGFADDPTISLSGKTAALNAATSTASAGSMAVGAAIDRSAWFTPLWELLGLAERPTKNLTMIATLAGATSAAGGDVAWEIPFVSY